MVYGCIGEHLSHSFSGEIHARLGSYPYELCEVAKEELARFMTEKAFSAINVTIPYKTDVIPYLDEISDEARAIGAVNTVVNRGGRLFGYNTDFYGIIAALKEMGITTLEGKKVLVLGTGGTSRTACAVAKHLGAREVLRVSRTAKDGAISYEDLKAHADADFLFNTTPVGMYPSTDGSPVSLALFPSLSGVFDAIYNPLRTRLVSEARARGIVAGGGLYMLVAQAFYASEIFFDKKYDPDLLSKVYKSIVSEKENIVLIGMPSSGKSTVGELLAKALSRPFFDADAELVKTVGRTIPDIFAEDGEDTFRALESETLAALSKRSGCIIATGGGAILREENVLRLKQNGTLVFLDRALGDLLPTPDRPTAKSPEAIEELYRARYEKYLAAADVKTEINGTPSEVCESIRKELSL